MKIFKPRLVVVGERNDDIVKGMYVMLDNTAESFWAHVALTTPTYYFGIVCTRLEKSRTYKFGDIVRFTKDNILFIR